MKLAHTDLPPIRETLDMDRINPENLQQFLDGFANDSFARLMIQAAGIEADWHGPAEKGAVDFLVARISAHKQQLREANGTASAAAQLSRLEQNPLLRRWDLMTGAVRDMPGTPLEIENPLLHVFTMPVRIDYDGVVRHIAGGAHIRIHGQTPGHLIISMIEPADSEYPHPYGGIGYIRFTGAYRRRLQVLRGAGDLAGYLETIFEYLTTWDPERIPTLFGLRERLTFDYWPVVES